MLELIVTVAAIAMLLAIVTPTFTTLRHRSRVATCQANLGQIGRAWLSYLDDNQGQFPRGFDLNLQYGGRQGTADRVIPGGRPKRLNPYLGLPFILERDAPMFRCPGDDGSDSIRPSHYAYFGTSYNPNPLLIGPLVLPVSGIDPCRGLLTEIGPRMDALTAGTMTDPSRLLLIGDYGWVCEWNIAAGQRIEWHGRPACHNVAFLDGHAAYLEISKGVHVTSNYSVIPAEDLQAPALECQAILPLRPLK